ncbi:cohesin domain-containing protein [Agaribacterium sp. ZY112]|uniref:cohesin domain-containing protein n=1 Tax=Agaribacterium sp. ZY112 TaxID=3233574 RepID=UPI003523412B
MNTYHLHIKSILFSLLLLNTAHSYVEATAQITWDKEHVHVGEVITLRIDLKNMPNVYGVQFEANYNKKRIKPIFEKDKKSVQLGSLWKDKNSFSLKNNVNTDNGKIELVHALLAPETSSSGHASLFKLSFASLNEGDISLDVEKLVFGTKEGKQVYPKIIQNTQPLILAKNANRPSNMLASPIAISTYLVLLLVTAFIVYYVRNRRLILKQA